MYSLRGVEYEEINVGSMLVLKEIRRLLISNGIKGMVISGQNPLQLILKYTKRKCLRNFLPLKSPNKSKICKFHSRGQGKFHP